MRPDQTGAGAFVQAPAQPAALPAHARTATRYRADIDGLRAIAVLAVVATHAGVSGFGGGYVGVDVFFVISGHLITRNLEHVSPAGWRGLAAFYGRRMRRTLPALYLVVLVTLTLSTVVLLPGELDALARSALATLLVAPNILLLTQAGYFDHAALAKPLLHTWSLGVEEQFYLVAPLLPVVLRRLAPERRKLLLLGLFGAGLAGCVGLQAVAAPAAFYLMPARLWEFLAGALVAEAVFPPLRARWLAQAVAALALVGLAVAIGTFSAATAHPGLPTLLPVMATAALIQIGQTHTTFAGRLLGALAGVGLISYSVYLWHWPLLSLAHIAGWPWSPPGALAGAATLLALSWASWRFVEGPFRDQASPLRRRAKCLLPAGATGLTLACGVIIADRGLPDRFSPEVAKVASYYDYADRRDFREGSCFITSKYGDARYFDRGTCLHLAADRANVLLVGDSHAAHLWAGFKSVFTAANVLQATASGCKPLLNATGKSYCVDLMHEVLAAFLPSHRVDFVVLSAAWSVEDAAALASTIATLQRYADHVVVLGRIPGHTSALPNLLARSLLDHDAGPVRAAQDAYPFTVDRRFKQALPAGVYVSLTDRLCPEGKCEVWAAPDVPLQFDTDHLTSEGSRVVATVVANALLNGENESTLK